MVWLGNPDKAVKCLVDGEEMSFDEFKAIDPSKIASIHVWKGETAIAKFGGKSAKGVIEVTTKNKLLIK